MNRDIARLHRLRRLMILSAATVAVCAAATVVWGAEPELVVPPPSTVIVTTSTSSTTTTSTTTSTSTTTTTTTVVPAEVAATFKCPDWVAVNHAVGFPVEELATADRILWGESRCRLTAINGKDPAGGSWCAFQINRIHEGHLLAAGIIAYWEQLIEDPVACASAAYVVYTRSNGWTPWATY